MLGEKISTLISSLFADIYVWIIKPFLGLRTFKSLIFGKDGDESLAFGIFTTDELNKIYWPGFNTFMILAGFAILIAIVMGGMKIASAGINPSNRSYTFEFFKDLGIVTILIFNLETIYTLIFGVNYSIISMFGSQHAELMEAKENLGATDGIIGDIIINLALLGLSIWANFYYMMRKLTLMMLMILGPLMITLYLIPRTKGITMGWLKELIGTVLVQSIHATLYWMMALMAVTNTGLEAIILYIIFIPVAESIRSLLGLGGQMTNGLSKAGAMMGLSALAGMYGSVKGALGDKSVMGAIKGAYNGAKDKIKGTDGAEGEEGKKTLGANTGTDSGTTSMAEKMLKAGEITSKMGKAAFGMAGAIAGSPMGPAGSIAGSTIGFIGGGAVGGVAGRVGAVAGLTAANQLGKGIKAGIKGGKDSWNAESLADEKLANEMADAETTKWANENKENFMKNKAKDFPDAHKDSLEGMWNKEVSNKRAQFLDKAKQTIGDIKKNDGQYANAEELANAVTEKMTNDWAKDNKDKFMEDYDKQNPISNVPPEKLAEHNQKRQQAWNNAVNQRKNEILNTANQAADQLTNEWAKNNKDEVMKLYDQANPIKDSMSDAEKQEALEKREQYWNSVVGHKRGENRNKAQTIADQRTQAWADGNKDAFMQEYDKQNPLPGLTEADITARNQQKGEAWNNAVNAKREQISVIANSTAGKLSNGIPTGNAFISKDQFTQSVAEQALNADKQDFATNYKANINPNATTQEIDVAFENQNGGKRVYLQKAQDAISGVQGAKLYNRGDVNTDYLATQIATTKTKDAKQGYIQNAINNEGLSNEQAQARWESVGYQETYNDNLKSTVASLPKQVSLDKSIFQNPVARVGQTIGNSLGGFLTATSGIKEIGSFIGDTKIGKMAVAGATGLQQGAIEGFQTPTTGVLTKGINTIGSAVTQMGSEVKVAFQTPHVAENVIGKQAGFRNAVSFATGMVGGVSGYKLGSKVGMKINPYNSAVNQQIKEVSDLGHIAQKVDMGNGETQIAPGAIQLVTKGNESFIQVRDVTGQTQIVSRKGTGNSSLKNGEVLYQDLNIQDGVLTQTSQAYKYDSAGGKIPVSQVSRVNPNALLANHNTPKNPYVVQEIQSLNQKVDAGQFHVEDIKTHTKDVRMVVTKERSYMVGKNSSGEEVRISPYGKGDARLERDEVVQVKCDVRNNRIVSREAIDISGKEIDFNTSLEPKDLVPTKQNKRLSRRNDFEKVRHRSLGGTV